MPCVRAMKNTLETIFDQSLPKGYRSGSYNGDFNSQEKIYPKKPFWTKGTNNQIPIFRAILK